MADCRTAVGSDTDAKFNGKSVGQNTRAEKPGVKLADKNGAGKVAAFEGKPSGTISPNEKRDGKGETAW